MHILPPGMKINKIDIQVNVTRNKDGKTRTYKKAEIRVMNQTGIHDLKVWEITIGYHTRIVTSFLIGRHGETKTLAIPWHIYQNYRTVDS